MSVRRKETYKIVEELVDLMNFKIETDNLWVDNSDGTYTLDLCDTYWLNVQSAIDVSATIYEIVSVVEDESITVSGSFLPATNTFFVNKPHFYMGTIVQANNDITESNKDVSARTPMAYLFRDLEDTFKSNESILDRETPIRLFFLHEANFEDFDVDVTDEEILKPMRSMAYYFVDNILRKSKLIGDINDEDYSIRDYSKFGTENASGYVNNIFNDHYSGVELNITLPIKKNYDCKC